MSSTAIIVSDAVFMGVSAASVGLRFYARKLSSEELAADDWLITVAWFFSASLAIINIMGIPLGHFGTPFESMSEDDTAVFLKFIFAFQFFYIFAVAFVKFSVLYFYKRIFSVAKTPLVIWTLLAVTIGWLISFFFATLFQAWPMYCNWVICTNSMDYPVMYVLSSVTDIILDVSILSLPTFFIWRLQMSSAKKAGIIGIFGLGIFCIVASIARLVYTIYFYNANLVNDVAAAFDDSANNIAMWSGIEACTSTTCANLPCFGPLLFKPRQDSSGGLEGRKTIRKPSTISLLLGSFKNSQESPSLS
ncbi:hypothetical protein MMC10_001269 [Thelotrema lepadinum]|nr:hypothetical protein [Thelotrema lepadinum]